MSGHSRWSQIKHQKGAADSKRGVIFSKLANAISVAARHGTDPEMNFQLRIAIDQARGANVPKDNIERAIERVKGGGASNLEEILFEAYGPGGTAFLIEAATDNRNRTIGEIRAILNKYDGKLAESGSVSYLFKRQGMLVVVASESAQEVELAAIDAGASDVAVNDDHVLIYTEPADLQAVRQALIGRNIEVAEASFVWEPNATIPLSDPKASEKVIKLSEALENLDDVAKVSSNFEISSKVLD